MANPFDDLADQHSPDRGWFYHRAGTDHGPMDREALAETLRLVPSLGVLVWHSSLPDWVSPAEASVRALIYGAVPDRDRPSGLGSLLFSFDGRLGRARFFWASCFSIALYVVVVMVSLAYAHVPINSETGALIRLALAPPFVWITLALTAKRLHDFDSSAVHLLWIAPAIIAGSVVTPGPSSTALTVVGGVIEIWLALKRGTAGPNRYGRGTLRSAPRPAALPKPQGGGGLNVWTGLVALGFGAVMLYVLAFSHLPSPSLLRSIDCSRKDIIATAKSAITSDPSETLALIMLGGSGNIRMTLADVRTLSYDKPLHGVTCAATVSTVPIDITKAANKSGGESAVTYTVQSTDANDGRYVVTIISD